MEYIHREHAQKITKIIKQKSIIVIHTRMVKFKPYFNM